MMQMCKKIESLITQSLDSEELAYIAITATVLSGSTGESLGATSGVGRGSTPEPSGTRATSPANPAGKTKHPWGLWWSQIQAMAIPI
jgi:hypothetical protein